MSSTARSLFVAALFAGFCATAARAQTPTLPYDHIHLNVPIPADAANWYEKYLGGTRITEAPDRLMFGSTRFMFLRSATAKPSAGSAIDHIGWRSTKPLADTMNELKAKGVVATSEPRLLNLPNGPSINFAYVAGPAGARIELVERPGLKPGQ